MTEAEEPKKLEPESPSDPPPAPTPAPVEEEKPVVEAPKDPESHKDKSEILPPPPENRAEPDESKALAIVEKPSEPAAEEKSKEDSIDRDAVLARVATEKKLSLIRAWEESEKSKAENKLENPPHVWERVESCPTLMRDKVYYVLDFGLLLILLIGFMVEPQFHQGTLPVY